jgi:hypothetical protein
MLSNYDQIVVVSQNLGCLEAAIESKYENIWEAVEEVKQGKEILQAAVVCRVNKIKYPDEVLAKIIQLKNAPLHMVDEQPEYKHNQRRNYERYLFVSNKYLPSSSIRKPGTSALLFNETDFQDHS